MEVSNELRDILIAHHKELRMIIPTERQVDIIKYVEKHRSVNSHDVAIGFNITLPNASTALRKLLDAGHIKRVYVGDPTGGTAYCYVPLDHRQHES
jgi:predicted transcriptional regulator